MKYLLIACLVFNTIAFADDGFFIEKPYGNTISPANNSFITMVSETVTVVIDYGVERDNSGTATVEAIFNFYNDSDQQNNVLMGFPFNWPHKEGADGINIDESLQAAWDTASLKFLDDLHFKSYIDGKLITTKTKKSTSSQNTDNYCTKVNWGTFTWAVNFAPKQKHRLISRYTTSLSEQVYSVGPGAFIFNYVARTGALWNGPIQVALFNFIIPERFLTTEIMQIAGIKATPEGYTLVNGEKNSTIQWVFSNWKPTDDFKYTKVTQPSSSRYISYEIITDNYIGDKKLYSLSLICPDKETFKQSTYFDDVKEFFRIKRNEIYARKGYFFNDKMLLYYFGKYDWYKPKYTDIKLNAIEKKNVNFIKSLEDSTSVFEDYLNK